MSSKIILNPEDATESILIDLVRINRWRRNNAYSITHGIGLCRCGCGKPTKGHAVFVKGHNGVQNPERRCYDYLILGDTVYNNSPCFLWCGARTPQGYGFMTVRGQKEYVHRWAYKRWIGPLINDEVIDHQCHNGGHCPGGSSCIHRACWNPMHLEQVDFITNIQRGMSVAAINARKTFCDSGHEFTEENTYYTAKGRECRKCKRQHFINFHARRAIKSQEMGE